MNLLVCAHYLLDTLRMKILTQSALSPDPFLICIAGPSYAGIDSMPAKTNNVSANVEMGSTPPLTEMR